VEGNINLLAVLRDAGVRRYLLQSSGFWYAPGPGLADESVPLISSASPGVEAGARTYRELEARASATPGIEFVALRYGFFYGPGTWYTREGDMGDQVRQQQVPIIGEGQGVYSFVHIDDAAGATAAALECSPGAYNIVDGNPSPQHLWLTAFARAAGAPAPPRVSEEEALRASGPDAVYYATRLRGASHEKARRELAFRPRPLEWI
jgi:nucleoside-diphosphate-sugar epimerase